MKILFYNHTGHASGAERVLLMVLARLDRERFVPVVVCPEDGPLMQMATDLDVPVKPVRALQARFTVRPDRLLAYFKSFFEVIGELRQRVKTIQPDFLHANSIRAGLVATVATIGLGTRVAWHLHDILPRHPFSTAIRLFACLSSRTRMIAVSQAVATNFVGQFPPLRKRTTVLLNGIELEKFRPGQTTGGGIRAELQIGEAEPLIGIVGQLTPRKGQLELIRAFARLTTKFPRGVLLIVGAALFNRDDEYAQLLKQTALELGVAEKVRMLGARSDVAEIMRSLDFLVVNSKVEPFGLVALEAMACGTTVLATASGGTAELINHGRNGWLVPVGDDRALAAAMIELSGDPGLRARLAGQGKGYVPRRFGADRYVADLQTFYLENCDSKSTAIDELPASGGAEAAKFA